MNEQLEVRPAPGKNAPLSTPPLSTPSVSPPRRRRRWPGFLIGLLLLIGAGAAGWHYWERRHTAAPPARQANGGPPQSVGVATIGTGDLDVTMSGLGAVTPLATVTVKTQINGQLQQLAFQEGQLVHKGDFLAQIDPRPYQVSLEQAQGALAKDTALLSQSRADNARYQTLGRQDSISRQQVEDQVFLVKQYEGQIVTDNANIDSAKLNLTYCHITSPVDGRVGIRMVDLGNYLQTSDAGIVVVTQLQPISVVFTLPEDSIAQVAKQAAAGPLQVTAYDRTDTTKIATGTLATMDNQIDPTTGTVKLRSMFPNDDNSLFPQQFVNAHLLVQTLRGVTVAPQAAVQHGAPGAFVYLVKPDNTVSVQVVKTGVTAGTQVQITEGLKPGDKVVTDGLDRLRDGARITVAAPPGAQSPEQPGAERQGGGRQRRPGAQPNDAPANPAPSGNPSSGNSSSGNGAPAGG